MIKSFKDREAEKAFNRTPSRRLPQDLQRVAMRKLRMLHRARSLDDLRIPPANRLEALGGERKGQYSIRINDQWRICFIWRKGDASEVEIVDYHQEVVMTEKKLAPMHPGEILSEEFLKPLGLSQNALARELKIPPRRVNEIVLGKRGVSADTALRLARYLGTSAEFWLGLQADFELDVARDRAESEIIREVKVGPWAGRPLDGTVVHI
ncbi:MAG: HigA family addiction module antidote protein [Desulfarculus sp.]|nr:HigA family addiction module antidote protein [Desulfarculus sp.]